MVKFWKKNMGALVIIAITMCVFLVNATYGSESEPVSDEPAYSIWDNNQQVHVFQDPYQLSDSGNNTGMIATVPINDKEMIAYPPLFMPDACRYGVNGHVLFIWEWISPDGTKFLLFTRIADGEIQTICQAEQKDISKMSFIGCSSDGRYHYLMTIETDDDYGRDNMFYLYDDITTEIKKIEIPHEKSLYFSGSAVSPDGQYIAVAKQTEDERTRLYVYTKDNTEKYHCDFNERTGFTNMYCDNQGNVFALGSQTAIIRGTDAQLILLDSGASDCISNMSNDKFILSGDGKIWFYSFDMDEPKYVCEGEAAYLMTPDAMKYDVSQAILMSRSTSRNIRYFINDYNGMCFFTPGGGVYRINDFEHANVTYLSELMYDYIDARYWTVGKSRDHWFFYCYHIRDDLEKILFLDAGKLKYLDVPTGKLDVFESADEDLALLAVNRDFSKAIAVKEETGYLMIDLETLEVTERKQDLGLLDYAYPVRTDALDGLIYVNNGYLMFMDYEGSTMSIDTSSVTYDFMRITDFAERFSVLSMEVGGERLWCTQENEVMPCIYKLNENLKMEQISTITVLGSSDPRNR